MQPAGFFQIRTSVALRSSRPRGMCLWRGAQKFSLSIPIGQWEWGKKRVPLLQSTSPSLLSLAICRNSKGDIHLAKDARINPGFEKRDRVLGHSNWSISSPLRPFCSVKFQYASPSYWEANSYFPRGLIVRVGSFPNPIPKVNETEELSAWGIQTGPFAAL